MKIKQQTEEYSVLVSKHLEDLHCSLFMNWTTCWTFLTDYCVSNNKSYIQIVLVSVINCFEYNFVFGCSTLVI